MIGCIAGVVGLVDDVEGFAEGDVLSTGVLGAAARWGASPPPVSLSCRARRSLASTASYELAVVSISLSDRAASPCAPRRCAGGAWYRKAKQWGCKP